MLVQESKRNLRQALLQWSFGMFVATPIIAIIQGSRQLSEYRLKHADAPRPVMPARGVAVAVASGIRPILNTQKPLRLLVVGDSLAAGVGMSKSGTPVLPESIARSLSKASGGRAVYWTCVGTPGVSASQIVQDIHQIEELKPGRLERLFLEWQNKRKKWQERLELRRRLTELESTGDEEDLEKPMRDYLTNWWETVRNSKQKSPKLIREATEKTFQEWWSQMTSRFQQTKRRVAEDLSDIKDIVQSQADGEEQTTHEDLIHKGNAFRRDTIDPVVVSQFDIAVVLTGLNDLKDAFMPHMVAGKASSLKEGTKRIEGGLHNQLFEVVNALDTKMDLDGEEIETGQEGALESSEPRNVLQTLRRPLVVVPELPIAPLSLFRLAPLCWFLIPLFRAMENNKKVLSARFPDYVVFIPQPDLKWWSDVEAGLGPIRDNVRQERLLLRVTDIALTARERIQELMKEHYESSESGATDENEPSDNEVEDEYQTYTNQEPSKGHSPFIAMDKMHPNDEGYELWGRHIAAAIIDHWKQDDQERSNSTG